MAASTFLTVIDLPLRQKKATAGPDAAKSFIKLLWLQWVRGLAALSLSTIFTDEIKIKND